MAEAVRPRRTPRAVLARAGRDPLLRSAYSLMLNVVLTSGSGVLFWIVAARMFSSETVGRDSALVSAMVVTYMICSLNLSSGLIRFLPVVKMDPRRVVLGAYGVTVSLSLAGGAAFVLAAPHLSHEYTFLSRQPVLAGGYVVAVALWGVFALQDSVLTAMRRAPWVPVENGLFGVLKLIGLPALLALHAGEPVFIAWVVPMALLLVPVNTLIFARVLPSVARHEASEPSPMERFGRRRLIKFLAQDYGAAVLMQLGGTALPLLIIALLGSSAGAYFYMPFTMVAAFDLLFLNVTASLTVEAARAEHRTAELLHTVIRRFGPLLMAGVTMFVVGAHPLLGLFGRSYADHGANVLRLLAAASVFRGAVAIFSAIQRIEGHASRVLWAQAATFVMVLGGSVPLGKMWGLDGIGVAWIVGNGVVALTTMPSLLRAARPAFARAANPRPILEAP